MTDEPLHPCQRCGVEDSETINGCDLCLACGQAAAIKQFRRRTQLRRLRAGSQGEAVAEQLRMAHDEATTQCGLEDESDEYWGFIAGWLGATAWGRSPKVETT